VAWSPYLTDPAVEVAGLRPREVIRFASIDYLQGSASRSGALDQLGEGGRRADRRKHHEHQARLGPVADTSGLANQDAEAQAEGYGQDGPFQQVTERKQPDYGSARTDEGEREDGEYAERRWSSRHNDADRDPA
jgi:hypothetical protein